MERNKKSPWIFLPLALLAVSVVILIYVLSNPALPRTYDGYEHFSITDCRGEEYVFANGEDGFRAAADAFSAAKPAEKKPSFAKREGMLLLDWMRDGYAHRYRLYLSLDTLSAYLEDESENGYFLDTRGALFFYQSQAARASLIGKTPASISIAGVEIPFSVCSWQYDFADAEGTVHTVSSEDYLGAADAAKVIPYPFFLPPDFAEPPTRVRYCVFAGNAQIADAAEPPISVISRLPVGQYQMTVIAEYEDAPVTVRAGYSVLFSVN